VNNSICHVIEYAPDQTKAAYTFELTLAYWRTFPREYILKTPCSCENEAKFSFSFFSKTGRSTLFYVHITYKRLLEPRVAIQKTVHNN
jgi:hypothetical protein